MSDSTNPDDESTAAEVSEGSSAKPRSFASKLAGWGLELVIIVVGALVISALLRTFLGQMFIIPSGSMENTLMPSDRVLVSKVGGFQRGDIVVFADPGGWMIDPQEERGPLGQALEFVGLLPNSSTNHLIKRVMGMPGDRVACCNDKGQLTVNGYALDESEYLYTDPNGVMVAPANVPFDVVVPKDRIFVMGDHRNRSGDSRCHFSDLSRAGPPGTAAFVPMSNVVGATVAIVSPLNRLRAFSVPKVFTSVPPPTGSPPDNAILNLVNPGC